MVMVRNLVKVGSREVKKRYIGNKLIFEDLGDKTEPLSGEEIYTDKADDAVVHVEVDGKSYQEGEPSPDNPAEIHSLNDFDVVSSVGKRNLLVGRENGNYILISNNSNRHPSIYKSYEDYDSVTLTAGNQLSTYASEMFTLEKGKKYTAIMYVYSSVRLDLSIISYSGDVWTIVPANTWTRLSKTFIGTGERERIGSLFSRNAEALNHEIFYNRIKLEEGDISIYSPAPEDITEDENHPLIDKINLLLDEPLRSVGDVKDRLFRDGDGLWKIERNVGEETLDGSERWNYYSTYNQFYITSTGGMGGNELSIVSSRHKTKRYYDRTSFENNTIALGGLDNNIAIFTDDFTTVSAFKNWLSSNNTQIVYLPENPNIETLPQPLQDKLNNLRSFQDSNYVYTIINDETDILPHHVAENLKPTLHTTFKSKGWYDYYLKTLLK